ncbi:MAG: hypothetical protein EZS28_031525, partial [Streblomastix strix]
ATKKAAPQTAVKKRVFRRRGRFRAHRAAQVRAVIPTANHQVNRAAMFRVIRAVIIIRVQIRNRAMKNLRVKAAAVMIVLIKGEKIVRTQEAVVNNHQVRKEVDLHLRNENKIKIKKIYHN